MKVSLLLSPLAAAALTACGNAAGPGTATAQDFRAAAPTSDKLALASVPASGSPSFVKVLWGAITHIGPAAEDKDAGAGQLVENKGMVTFDLTALASVKTSERARGQITDTFDNVHDPDKGVKRSATIVLTNFMPEEGDGHGPRNGSYLWLREPSVGGKFQFQDTVTLFCLPNPAGVQSDLMAVSRWYNATDGGVHGRSDAKATGGQLDAGFSWIGVTCAKGQTTSEPAEGYWMMKLEQPDGGTSDARSSQVGTDACGAGLGTERPGARRVGDGAKQTPSLLRGSGTTRPGAIISPRTNPSWA